MPVRLPSQSAGAAPAAFNSQSLTATLAFAGLPLSAANGAPGFKTAVAAALAGVLGVPTSSVTVLSVTAIGAGARRLQGPSGATGTAVKFSIRQVSSTGPSLLALAGTLSNGLSTGGAAAPAFLAAVASAAGVPASSISVSVQAVAIVADPPAPAPAPSLIPAIAGGAGGGAFLLLVIGFVTYYVSHQRRAAANAVGKVPVMSSVFVGAGVGMDASDGGEGVMLSNPMMAAAPPLGRGRRQKSAKNFAVAVVDAGASGDVGELAFDLTNPMLKRERIARARVAHAPTSSSGGEGRQEEAVSSLLPAAEAPPQEVAPAVPAAAEASPAPAAAPTAAKSVLTPSAASSEPSVTSELAAAAAEKVAAVEPAAQLAASPSASPKPAVNAASADSKASASASTSKAPATAAAAAAAPAAAAAATVPAFIARANEINKKKEAAAAAAAEEAAWLKKMLAYSPDPNVYHCTFKDDAGEFFFSSFTEETSYELPATRLVPKGGSAKVWPIVLPPGWGVAVDGNDKAYFFHDDGHTTYKLPDGCKTAAPNPFQNKAGTSTAEAAPAPAPVPAPTSAPAPAAAAAPAPASGAAKPAADIPELVPVLDPQVLLETIDEEHMPHGELKTVSVMAGQSVGGKKLLDATAQERAVVGCATVIKELVASGAMSMNGVVAGAGFVSINGEDVSKTGKAGILAIVKRESAKGASVVYVMRNPEEDDNI